VSDILNKNGYESVIFSEPTYESKAGKTARHHLDDHIPINGNELLKLFMDDRLYDTEKNIDPALKLGKIVLMDRYFLSSCAYEANLDCPWQKVMKLNRARFIEPDIWFVLTPGVECAWSRLVLRGQPLSQYESKSEMYRLQDIYDEIIENDPIGNYIRIDSSGDKPYETAQTIYKHIKKYMVKNE
jgi:dTMP kinase